MIMKNSIIIECVLNDIHIEVFIILDICIMFHQIEHWVHFTFQCISNNEK